MSSIKVPRTGTGTIAVVVSGWPRLSETFAVNELSALARTGRMAGVFATKPGDITLIQPDSAALDRLVTHLDPADSAVQAARLAELLYRRNDPVVAIHGYFTHQPTEVAEQAAGLLGVPFSFSAHALDARKVSADELGRRARSAAVVTTCNSEVTTLLRRAGGRPVEVPHGVDLCRFHPVPPPDSDPVQLLAVGRLVAKKGFVHLLDAMAELGSGVRLRIVGDGPDGDDLRDRISRLGLAGRVELVGRRTHDELPALYHSADIVVVPSVIDAAGDCDGLPNVVLEAMASGRPVVASRVAAIPSAISWHEHDSDTGVLVAPGDSGALARAIGRLIADRRLRVRLGAQARARVARKFDLRLAATAWVDVLTTTHSMAGADGG